MGDFCAVLVLDGTGRIASANASARKLWQVADHELVGEHFVSQFAFEVVSNDPDFLEAQWEVLVASSLDRFAILSAQPREGAPRPVRVRLEKTTGNPAGYIATAQPPAAAPAAKEGAEDPAAAFKLLAEKSALGFFDLNLAAGRCQYSPAWKKMLGYAVPELADTLATWHELIHPDDSAAAPDKIGKKVTPGARPFNVEFRMKHQRGDWVWIQCTGVQLINAAGGLERVLGLHLDVSERKELEDSLVANDARLQDLSSSGPLAAFELDFANKNFWYSPAWEQLLGHEEGTLAPEAASFAAALPAEEVAGGVEEWLLSRAVGQTSFLEVVRLRAKDGHAVPVLLGAHRTVTRKRELTRVVGFACALPAGAMHEEGALPALLTTEAFGALAEAVIFTDAAGKIIFANSTATRMLQLPPAQITGQKLGDVFRLVNRQSNRPSDDPVERALSADKTLPLISDDALSSPIEGETATPVVWTARAAIGADGKPRGAVIVFRNPEEMTLTPEELVRANRFESLGLLAGGIAHDFNNLLTTILGAISLAKDNRDYTSLGDAEKACMTAKGLTKQLLSFAKGGSGTHAVSAAREIIEDSIKIAAAASSAEITLDVPEATEPVLVDKAQILQVFQNLIVNALQAMPPPPHAPRLQIRATNVTLADQQVPGIPGGPYVEFEVRDNGSGIKPEHVAKIFDP
ncbi:MAG TPA: PAS domain-containing protein, partial [Opitutaceae bacterium]|nr:PAS domain-containing protein [Opitutaceae bacterium]